MISLELNEGDRQMVLLALAHLSVERRGWEDALHTIALMIDNQKDGRALMFDEFRALHRRKIVERYGAARGPRELPVAQLIERLLRYADDIESEGRSYAPAVMREAAQRLAPPDQKGSSRS